MQSVERKEQWIEWCSDQANDYTTWSRFSFIKARGIKNGIIVEERLDTNLNETYDLKTPKEMREVILNTPNKKTGFFCKKNIDLKQDEYSFFHSNIWDTGKVYHIEHIECIHGFCGLLPGPGFIDYMSYLKKLFVCAVPLAILISLVFYFIIN